MNRAQQCATPDFYAGNKGHSRMKQQLIREITCLERQLERLRLRNDLLDLSTVETYEDMITSRQAILDNLRTD